MENTLHHLPFLVGCGIVVARLELSHMCLPFSLSRQGGKSAHCRIPVEVGRSVNNHHKACALNVNLHFENAHSLYATAYLGPEMFIVVSLAITTDYLVVVAFEVHGLHIPLGRLVVVLGRISVSFHIH